MTRHAVISLATALCMAAAASGAHAHHAYGLFFDLCKSLTIEGQVERVQWKDPHILIDVKTDDGTAWVAEWTLMRTLKTLGVAIDTAPEALKAGDRVVVTGSPMKPEAFKDKTLKIVSALRQIRRASDGWTWTRNGLGDALPPDCQGK